MPKIIDPAILQGKQNRNERIRKTFKKFMDEHRDVAWSLDQIVLQEGLSESTITKIIKEYGCYKPTENEPK